MMSSDSQPQETSLDLGELHGLHGLSLARAVDVLYGREAERRVAELKRPERVRSPSGEISFREERLRWLGERWWKCVTPLASEGHILLSADDLASLKDTNPELYAEQWAWRRKLLQYSMLTLQLAIRSGALAVDGVREPLHEHSRETLRVEFLRSGRWTLYRIGSRIVPLTTQFIEDISTSFSEVRIAVTAAAAAAQVTPIEEHAPIPPPYRHGRKPVKLEAIKAKMEEDLRSGRHTEASLNNEKQEALAAHYGASRTWVVAARNAVLKSSR